MQTNEEKSGRYISLYAPYVIIILTFILIGGYLFFITYENVKRETIDNLNARQMLHARQAAKGIEAFFEDHIRLLESLAKDPDIISLTPEGRKLMRELKASHAGEISIISRIDRQGRIIHSEPYYHSAVGQSVTSINDFLEAKKTKRVVISDVFTSRRGSKTIIIYAPILKKGSFDGTVAMLLPFDVIAKRYVQDIRIGQDGYAWVISKGGTELSCPVPGHEGNSVLVNCKDFPDILAMAEKMMRGEQGVTTYTFDRVRGSTVSRMTKHAAYMPINLRNQFWSVVVATPEDEALSPLEGFRNRLLLIALIFSIGIIFYIYTLLKNRLLADEVEQRKRTEAELRIKTDELDRYFTSSPDLLCIADTGGHFRRLNPEWERTLGYPLAELEGRKFIDLVHPDDVETTLKAVGRLADTKEVLNFVNRYRHRNGSYRFMEWKSYPVGSMIYAVARDITRRKQMEESLTESEERFRVIFNSVHDFIFIKDSDRRYTMVNNFFLNKFRIDSDVFIGKTEQEISIFENASDTTGVIIDTDQRVLNGETVEYSLTHKILGTWITFDIIKTPLRDKQGNVVGICGLSRDITDRKITEEKINDLVAHQDALLAAIPDIIMEVDSSKTYRWANRAGLEFFGEDAIGRSADFYFEGDQDTYEAVQPIFNGSEDVVYVESWQRRRDGEKRLLAWWCRVIKDGDGIVTGALSSARDITDDRARQEELKESRRRLADIISFLPDATMVIDKDGRVIAWNRAIEEMTGVKAEEMIGRGDYEYALPFYGERRPILIDLALHPDTQMETRYTTIHRFGDILFGEAYTPKLAPGNVHLSATASVLRDSRGEIIAAIECIRDTTERKLADDALKESERRMADIINFLPDAALVIDKNGYVIAWNRAIEEITGIKAENMLGKGNFEYSLPFYGERRPILVDLVLRPREETEDRYKNIKWQGDTLVGEAYMPSLRGRRAYLLGTASPLYNIKGSIVGAIETIRDITDRRQMEDALSAEREQLASTLDGIPVPGFVIDKECKVILWNRSNEVYTGRPKESMLGKKIDLGFLFKGKDLQSLAEIILTMQDEEIIRRYGHRGVTRSEISPGTFESMRTIWLHDEERIMSIQAARIYNPQGEIIGAVQTAQDITERIRAEAERKHLQDQLNQAQKLEAIGTLAGGIAHDFNNMLAAIIGYTELTIDEPDEKLRRRKLSEVLKASKKAKDLVRQILTFSRNTEQEKKPLDMKLVTKEALKLLRSTLPATVEIRQNLTAEPCMINADLTQMHQIIMNLCTNAAQAMGERGGVLEVSLSLEYIKDSILRQHPDAVAGPYVRMTVSDTGQGIDPAIKDRIFEPFFTTKGIGEGTGLGLSVVYGIVKNHGGIITAESEHGYKTVFDVYLPAIGSMEPREEAPVPEDVPQGSERILLVDDDQTLLAMGKLMLESLGYTVDVRTSGMEALGSFLADPGFYDLVITDMTMPLMTGSELAVEFLRIRPDMPIILCTGFSEFIDEEKAKDIGLKAFVMKPFSKKTIGRIVRKVLDE